MLLTEAFRRYNATLKNINWSVCAENPDGELVVSMWSHYLGKKTSDSITYVDRLSRWSGPGNNELRRALHKAAGTDQVIRAVIARTEDPQTVDAGQDASTAKKTFFVREDWYGKVVVWDGDHYEIEFRRKA
jgi:hypothetical protein